jgi:cardiolipin synthase
MNYLNLKLSNFLNSKNIQFLLLNKTKLNYTRILASFATYNKISTINRLSNFDLINKQNFKIQKIITNERFFSVKINKLFNVKNNKEIKNSNDLIFTIPNILTMARIASIPFISYFVFINQYDYACGLFVLAAVTDFLDGYIARNWPNQLSNLGSIIDPLADKLLIGTLTVTLALTNMMPLELAILILGRDIVLIMSSLFIRYKTLDKPVTLEKFINVKKYASVKVEADMISKINTFLQLSLISLTLPSILFCYQDATFLVYLQYLTGLTTILSSISYLYKGGSYKLIKK